MDFAAHSPPDDRPEKQFHLYSDHVAEVLEYGLVQLKYILSFCSASQEEQDHIISSVRSALTLHDMGKLDKENQPILRGEKKGRLPIDHIEAGVAVAASIQNELMGWLIRGHHAPGLPSKEKEKHFIKQLNREIGKKYNTTSLRGLRHNRSKQQARNKDDYFLHYDAIKTTDDRLEDYIKAQKKICGAWSQKAMELPTSGITTRLLLSCLVNADHESAAAYSEHRPMPNFIPANTNWVKRLKSLNSYVQNLPKDSSNERHQLRDKFYHCCNSCELQHFRANMCSAPVGLGKTTSVMAYLLRKAIQDKSSRIIIIAPFSNIIDQTVNTLRKAIALENEDPEDAVAANHHKAEFSHESMRQYSSLWQAPIVVTTAVQFFETLASAHPTNLRKLSAVVGASIFIDESHACLPVQFLKLAWHWLKELSDRWGCNIVFSSGSIVEFWNDRYLIGEQTQKLHDLFPPNLRELAAASEKKRVIFKRIENHLSLTEFLMLIQSNDLGNKYLNQSHPSCLVILNTVQSCAVVAESLAKDVKDCEEYQISKRKVLHLSTALSPKDRGRIIKEIERRQKNSEWNGRRWFLVATSCVEAGVDLDFAVGFRERCSITSFLQISGRINRHGSRAMGVLYDFALIPERNLISHPGFEESIRVFNELWEDLVTESLSLTELSTIALRKEYSRLSKKEELRDTIFLEEEKCNFQQVSEKFNVISSDTATVIVDRELVKKLELKIPIRWQEIQAESVQLWMYKINKLKLRPIKNCETDKIYNWIDSYEYDANFLGIMGGLLKLKGDFYIQQGAGYIA